MNNKKSTIKIIVGSLIIGLADAYLYQFKGLSFFETFAGYGMLAFVVMLFLTIFESSARSKRTENARTRDSASHSKHKKSTGAGSSSVQKHEDRLSGHIKWYDSRKGFGFLVYGQQEIFFHRHAIRSRGHHFQESDPALFYLGESEKGPQATAVWYNDTD